MSKVQDYVPRGNEAFNVWSRFLIQYVTAKCTGTKTVAPQWKHIPAEALSTLNAVYIAWSAACARCLEPHGKPVTESSGAPIFVIKPVEARILAVDYRAAGSVGKAKSYGCQG